MTVTKYLGRCGKMSQSEVMQKAKKMKAEALGLQSI